MNLVRRIWCPDLQHSTTTNSENNPWRAIGSDVQYGVRDPEALFLSALTEFNKALALVKHSFNTSTVALILFIQKLMTANLFWHQALRFHLKPKKCQSRLSYFRASLVWCDFIRAGMKPDI